ncbi:hypothetical protein Peur_035444 [Populus x canadensis]
MHSECALLRPTVSYKGHRFLLLFLEKVGTKVYCKTCDTPCDSPVFHCAECDSNLHLLCGPLPCTIGHEYCMIPFSLQILHAKMIHISFIVMPVRRKETQGYQSITARITISLLRLNLSCPRQVILALQGKYGDVELRTLDGGLYGKVVAEKIEVAETAKQRPNK